MGAELFYGNGQMYRDDKANRCFLQTCLKVEDTTIYSHILSIHVENMMMNTGFELNMARSSTSTKWYGG
jgi:hypothetical protein